MNELLCVETVAWNMGPLGKIAIYFIYVFSSISDNVFLFSGQHKQCTPLSRQWHVTLTSFQQAIICSFCEFYCCFVIILIVFIPSFLFSFVCWIICPLGWFYNWIDFSLFVCFVFCSVMLPPLMLNCRRSQLSAKIKNR